MMAVPVPRDHIAAMWPHVGPHLARAAVASGWDEGDLHVTIEGGTGLVWAVLDGDRTIGAALSELHGDVAYAALLGGVRFHEWAAAIVEAFEAWARSAGCARAVVQGRPGWARALRAHGYALRNGKVVKELV